MSRQTPSFISVVAAAGVLGCLPGTVSATSDFEREVAPILEAKCLFCHDDDTARGGLRLSTKASALEHGDALVPGDVEASFLLQAVSGPDPEMPKDETPLTAAQVEILRKWIAAGAEWPEERALVYNPVRDLDWWSLRPLPAVGEAGEGESALAAVARSRKEGASGAAANRLSGGPHPVDRFIGDKLGEKGLAPAEAADPHTLVRRVTYDLTGLPPTPEEVESFLRSVELDADAAWRELVDRLLDSPSFGEKWAQHWLDVARYGETHGYDKDKPRENAWPYRDYVIRSFNEDKPWSRFVQEQVAGDVLFPGTPEGVVALGFLAAGPWDFIGHWEVGEGKLDGRIAKHLDRDEMVSAVFNAFQSVTVQCAQCHHHKFDPVRMEDYYRLQAVFAAVDRADRVYGGLPPEAQKQKNAVLAELNALREEEERLNGQIKRLLGAKVSEIDRRLAELKAENGAEKHPAYGYHSQIAKSAAEEKWVQLDLGQSRSVSEVRLYPAHDDFNGIGAGFGFPLRYRVEAAEDEAFTKGRRILHDATESDQPNPGTRPIRIPVEAGAEPFRYLRLTATKLAERKNDYILALGELEVAGEAGGADKKEMNFALTALVSAKDSIEQAVRWKQDNLVDGIFYRELEDAVALAEYRELRDRRAAIEREVRPPGTDARLAEIEEQRNSLNEQLKAFPEGAMVYAAATDFTRGGKFIPTGGKPRPVHLLHRGDVGSPQEPVSPGAPPLWAGVSEEFLLGENGNEGEARAELARYLTRPDNPLLWRSLANRVWQWTFDRPLVATPNDFGRGGAEPSHPELLDFLAASLRDDPDQSVKGLVRLLVTSEAYRLDSQANEANEAIDGENRYFWRANRRRLTAEEFRDSALAVSGVLDRSMGGPSFRDFVIEKPQHSPHYQYHLHDPDDPDSHRRSVYRLVVRSQPQPMLTTLDCADPSMSVPQRDESTTALQALTQWNNRFVESMSRHFAARLREEAPVAQGDKVERAIRLALGRAPLEEERLVLLEHLEEHGEESLARVVLNLNAFVYVD